MFERLKSLFHTTSSGKLETFIHAVEGKLDRGQFPPSENPTEKIAQSFSLVALTVAGELHSGIVELLKALPGPAEKRARPSYDVVTFEAAAYCHYYLMKDYLSSGDDDDEETEDPYFECLRWSAHFTAALLKRYADFEFPADTFFSNRTISYGLPRQSVRKDAEKLGHLILASKEGRPAISRKGSIDLEGLSPIAVHSAIGIWHPTVESLSDTFPRAYKQLGPSNSDPT